MKTRVARTVSRAFLRDGEALLVGDVAISLDGNALRVSRPEHALYYVAPTVNDAEDMASGYTCGPWPNIGERGRTAQWRDWGKRATER